MLQPFKFITVVMKDRTNLGMEIESAGRPHMSPLITLADDMRYHPITLNDDGYGVMFSNDNKSDHASVGVLMESFNKTFAQHKVMIHGIVTMRAHTNVRPGMSVYWDVDAQEVTITKTNDTPYIGRAMASAKVGGDHVDVLIG